MRKRPVVFQQRMEPHQIVLKGRIGYHVLWGSLASLDQQIVDFVVFLIRHVQPPVPLIGFGTL